MKSNISVGPPIDLVMVQADQFKVSQRLRLRTGDPYLAKMRKLWESALKQAFDQMPPIEWNHSDPADADQEELID